MYAPKKQKSHCRKGHRYTRDTIWINSSGNRTCTICRRLRALRKPVPRRKCGFGHSMQCLDRLNLVFFCPNKLCEVVYTGVKGRDRRIFSAEETVEYRAGRMTLADLLKTPEREKYNFADY